jgi:hypothetical protein
MNLYRDKKTPKSKKSALRKVPNNPTYNIDRFAGRSEQIACHQPSQSPASENPELEKRIIAAKQARASALLQAFEAQFSHSSKPPPKR